MYHSQHASAANPGRGIEDDSEYQRTNGRNAEGLRREPSRDYAISCQDFTIFRGETIKTVPSTLCRSEFLRLSESRSSHADRFLIFSGRKTDGGGAVVWQ